VEISDVSIGKKDFMKSTVKQEYNHLFASPIDAMFALLPYITWEVMVTKIYRYAANYLRRKNVHHISGYLWKPIHVNDMLTYFGILIYSMLYPQTGHRMRTAWKDQRTNAWTMHMGIGKYLQISSMLHFNDNENEEGVANDALHKIRPILEIIKKTLGRYADLGSEFSFDETTMACFSRYGRNLVTFNPKKPTGKFHFKIYMLCCATTNLVYKIQIHTKDRVDMADECAEGDEDKDIMMNKTDKLTLEMCMMLNGSGLVVNMDNYYMLATTAMDLRKHNIYCHQTVRSKKKLIPKSVLCSSREYRELPRGSQEL
jgi:hypothetical protein